MWFCSEPCESDYYCRCRTPVHAPAFNFNDGKRIEMDTRGCFNKEKKTKEDGKKNKEKWKHRLMISVESRTTLSMNREICNFS
ncbi:hypothetical protein MRB53_007689 [Persea americana]|uniref:Uncharacterized protein n=1 Tax=Persea americana TaxID=3435 RepID=A0ACC2MJK5_PERAE|nr:hypothetical protein MRB53_007689 [Persea americana]